MKMMFKQRLFSWFDSYDIYDEYGDVLYTVEGKMSWGHKLHIMDKYGEHIATVKQVVLTLLPKFELYEKDKHVGTVSKELTLFKPKYNIDGNGWHIEGDYFEWDYTINSQSAVVAVIRKEIFHLTDTYTINVADGNDALCALMVVLAIDAEKCSRD